MIFFSSNISCCLNYFFLYFKNIQLINMPQLKNPVINFILQFVLNILLMIIITEMPSLLDELQPDSSNYINFQSYRKSIYPLILDFKILLA